MSTIHVVSIRVEIVNLSKFQTDLPRSEEDEAEESFKQLLENTVHKCGVLDVSTQTKSTTESKNRFSFKLFAGYFERNPQAYESQNLSKVINYILRYVKLCDRWVAFTSLLLKSRLYNLKMNGGVEKNEGIKVSVKPIVLLPRTEAGKPYIPSIQNSEIPQQVFSISHQYPFVGLGSIVHRYPGNSVDNQKGAALLQLGLDIVMFDGYKQTIHLYESKVEFLQVFQQSFTPWEWDCITSTPIESDARIKEFFIRWSMKESYTKAIGTGMSTAFSSFETRLCGVDDDGNKNNSLWSYVSSNTGYTHLKGEVTQISVGSIESWEFIFKPLYKEEMENKDMCGCACVCLRGGEQDDLPFEVQFLPTNLDTIIEYHLPNSS